ncbi:acyl-CoA Delta(11) desaturase-like [Tribolium castaneum]|uniref:Acyl-CoA Delta(11) desaturase-like Protein n=1 Tax=Tribolium castaneum TaxID=7070 RepID=D2A4K2_TRICA|nr:acyl-CoA Delta(11) desaturase-like [Tribolium castaneum]AHH30810.1 fatty acid desaturase D3 [Tribolium castaneum]EFA05209.1 Acyl-CoA Delta(11) desaturase-like Protein [Tribolium castaneum]|eukprot:NP_001306194.1 acyl-CoA Delta(11) desaturase-like [Tribolium castaneum]
MEREIAWKKVFFFVYLHLGALYGLYLILTEASWLTCFWFYFLVQISTQGTGAGVHRLWAHRAYKATVPLRLLLTFYQTLTFQKDIYDWVRDHRVHHKYSDTEPDPHNASNGFFYSHMGWLMLKKTQCTIDKGKKLDLSDLEADPIVMFQRKYYWYLAPVIALGMPAFVPWYFWGERFVVSWYVCSMFRYCLTLHGTCLVNSAAHIYGNRPYDKNILPTQNLLVSYITNGEGFHNYHHAFPWDYKAAELGSYYGNWSTAFIDFMARIGWAYDLKSVPLAMVEKRVKRTGDGTHNVWGWGDKDLHPDDAKMVEITHTRASQTG